MRIVQQAVSGLSGAPANTKIEFLRFLPVSIVTSIIDFGLLILLTEVGGVHYLMSAAIAFVAGQIWLYAMCVNWIFARLAAKNHASGFALFILLSLLALAATELIMWIATEDLGFYYILSKVVASALTSFSLFYVRKRVLFS